MWTKVVSAFLLTVLCVVSYAQQVEHFSSSRDATVNEQDLALAKRAAQARAVLRKQLAEEKAAGEKLIREQLAQEKADGEKLLQEQLAEEKAKAERDLTAYIAEQKATAEKLLREKMMAAERKIFVPVETSSTSGQSNVRGQATLTNSLEEFLKRDQSSSTPSRQAQAASTDSFEEFLKRDQSPSRAGTAFGTETGVELPPGRVGLPASATP